MDALQDAIDMMKRDKENRYATVLPPEHLLPAYTKIVALAAIAQAEQLKRIADMMESYLAIYGDPAVLSNLEGEK